MRCSRRRRLRTLAETTRSDGIRSALAIASLVAIAGTRCSLSHTPLQKREQNRRIITVKQDGKEDVEEMHKSRPIVRRSRDRQPFPPEADKLDALAKQLKAEPFPLEDPCVGDECPRSSLDRIFAKLERMEDAKQGRVRILHLGDSHVAADYITGTARKWLQHRFGNAGRGFVAVDQRAEYGGRRLHRTGWKRTRATDKGHGKESFGFAAMSLESRQPGARVDFKLDKDDAEVTVFYQTSPHGARLKVLFEEIVIGELDTRTRDEQSLAKTFRIPGSGGEGERGEKLALVASDSGVRIFGLSFEAHRTGVFYDAVGPVGADARVYLSMDRKSFKESMRALAPDLIVLMVGGNDALAMRKGVRSLDDVRTDHERIIEAFREAAPEADCMLWSPMDAGEMIDGRIVSKKFVSEVRNMQKAAASKLGCAFWDMFESMGAEGSFARWHDKGIMNDDLVHPRMMAGELLGHLFSAAFLDAYSGEH